MNELLDHALTYAEKMGWKLHPCKKDKTPYLPAWQKNASCDPDQIKEWWAKWPNASIGCKCGPDSKIWVLDIDLPDGPDTLEKLLSDNSPLPLTLIQKTGSGGKQIFFSYNGVEIRNSAKKAGPGIDVRGDGGYIILPPSNHPSGKNYEWLQKKAISQAPAWLVDIVKKPPTKHVTHPQIGGNSKYGLAALLNQIIELSGSGVGNRNDKLNASSFSLGQLVAGGELEMGHVENSLLGVALATGLSEPEARKTLQSGLTSGMQSPRSAPESSRDDDYYGLEENGSQHSQHSQHCQQFSTVLNGSQQFSTKNQPETPNNLAGHIKQFIENSTGCFTTRDIDTEFGLKTRKEKQARSSALLYMARKRLINKDKGVAGKYHIIDNQIEWVDLDAPSEETFPVILPFDLHNKIIIPPKAIIILAGSTNAGKTAFILNTLRMNRQQKYKKIYLMSEMGSGEYISRIRSFGEPVEKWKSIKAASRSYDFNGVIEHHNKNGLTCIDYLEEIQGEYFKIASNIRDIYDSLGDGVALVAIQKRSDQKVARGGEGTMEKSRLYLTLDHLCTKEHSIVCALTITKLKAFKNKNLQNHELHFEITRGAQISTIMDWKPCHKVDRDRAKIAYQNEASKMRDTTGDSLDPVYFHQRDNKKSFRVTEDTVVKWGAQFSNISDIYYELQKLADSHVKKPFIKNFIHLCNVMADINNKKEDLK